MPTDITVTELKETVTVTGGTTSITVSGDVATVNVANTIQPVSVVEETNTFTISTTANKADVGLGNVDNTSDANKPVSTATQTALDAKLSKAGGTMTGSLTLAADPTQNLQAATKQYVDGQVNSVSIASTDDVPEGELNLYYTSSRANTDFDTRLATKSTTNLAEGSNQYFTTARARASVSGSGSIAYNSTTGVISYTGGSNPTNTDELPEGTTNKYFTNARADARVAAGIAAIDYPVDSVNGKTNTVVLTTSDIAEGTNQYYTESRADARVAAGIAAINFPVDSVNGKTDTVVLTTSDIAEGTNLYYTDAKARASLSAGTGVSYDNTTGAIAIDSTVATKTYADNAAASAVANLVDSAPATLDTLNELAAALGDDPNFATTMASTLASKLDVGGFADAFDGQLAGKTTDDVTEGTTNKYYTDARSRGAISVSGSLSYNSTTGVISYTEPTLATVATTGAYSDLTGKPTLFSGSYTDLTNKPSLFSGAYADLTGKPTLFDGAYSSLTGLPTLFSGAYADLTGKPTLFDGAYSSLTGAPSLATVATSGSYNDLSNKPTIPTVPTTVSSFTNDSGYITTSGARSAISASGSLSYNSSTGVISYSTPTTDGVTEGSTNLYFTDARARTAVSNGTDLDVSSGSVYVKTMRDGTKVLGSLQATGNTSYTFPPVALNSISNNNGLDAASSMGSGSNLGFGAQGQFTHYYGDTFAGTNTTGVFSFKAANGNSASSGTVPFTGAAVTAPSAVTSTSTLGGLNFNGYATTGFTDYIATQNQGGGFTAGHALAIQGAPAETFADGTLTISGATITAVSRVNVAQTVSSVSGTRGQLTIPSTLVGVGTAVIVTGTLTGTATGISAGTYYVVANNGGASNSTVITLGTTPGGAPITTTAGTTTGLTFTRQLITVTYSAQSYIPFGANAKVTISGFTNVTNGTYMVLGTSTTTSVSIGAPSSGVPALGGSQSISTPTVTNAGAQYRVRGFPTAIPMNSGNRLDFVSHTAASATYRADSFVIAGGAYGNTGSTRVTVDATKASFAVPVAVPAYTAVALRAITGAVGYMASVSDSGGKIAYWDTTNSRWSFVFDNSAV